MNIWDQRGKGTQSCVSSGAVVFSVPQVSVSGDLRELNHHK